MVVALGCSHPSAPEPTKTEARSTELHVKPFDLLVKGPEQVTAWRARLVQRTRAWLTPEKPSQPATAPEADEYVAIQEVRETRVRIFDEIDGTRLLLWIPRDDLGTTIVRVTELAVGVVARTGAPVLERSDDDDGAVRVTVAANGLIAEGSVRPDAVGDVWIADRTPVVAEEDSDVWLPPNTEIRASAADDAASLAQLTDQVYVNVLGERDEWSEVETLGSLLAARGWVRTSALVKNAGALVGGFGYGMLGTGPQPSDTIAVPAGTCLYDAADGGLVGVTTSDRSRVVAARDAGRWTAIEIDTEWGTMTPFVHDDGDGFERCSGPLSDP